jgi:hypothetical protein
VGRVPDDDKTQEEGLTRRVAASADGGSRPLAWRAAALPRVGLAALVALKLGALAAFGPIMTPDGTGYVAYAEQILSGDFRHVDLAANAGAMSLIRTIGYPAVIAAAELVAGADWSWAVVLLQFALSLLASIMVFRLARCFGLGTVVSLGVAAAQATGIQFSIDLAIASDSLCASALTIAACTLAQRALGSGLRRLWPLLGAGGLIAVAFLMRDVIAFLAAGFVPVAAAAARVQPTRRRQWAAFAVIFIPLLAAYGAYVGWNKSRLDAYVVTTIPEWTLLDALAAASQYDPTIFSGTAPVDVAARRVFKFSDPGQRLEQAFEADHVLHSEQGWTDIRIAHEITIAYLQAWLHHPAAMVRHALSHFSETQLHQAVRPVETVRDLLLWTSGSDQGFAREYAVRDGRWWMIFAIVPHRILEAISVAVFSAFVLLTPYRLWREGLSVETSAAIGLWCPYLTFSGLYGAVHLEPRYLAPVVAGSVVVGAVNLEWLAARFRQRSKSSAPADVGLSKQGLL